MDPLRLGHRAPVGGGDLHRPALQVDSGQLAEEKGVSFQQYLDEMGDSALRGYLRVAHPDNGQHR